jgi:uncharacterized protein (UPF0335 family)
MKTNVGHNSGINKNTAELLKKYIEGVEIYQDQIKDLQGSKKEIFDEAKAEPTKSALERGNAFIRSGVLLT